MFNESYFILEPKYCKVAISKLIGRYFVLSSILSVEVDVQRMILPNLCILEKRYL
jgi:hypothetical protein